MLIGVAGSPFYIYSLGNNTLSYTSNDQSKIYQLCSYDNGTVGLLYNATLTLSGASSPEVATSVNYITIKLGDIQPLNLTIDSNNPIFDTTNQSWVKIPVSSNISGSFLYSVQELDSQNLVDTLTLAHMVNYLTNKQTTLQNQSDYLSYLYNSPRNMILGNLSVGPLSTIITNIVVTNYFPGTTYSVCGYFQNPSQTLNFTISCKNVIFTATPP